MEARKVTWKQDRQISYNLTLRCVHVTIVTVEKEIRITYSECVSVALSIQHVMRMCRVLVVTLDIFVNCNWVNTWWQCYSTHNQYIEQHNNNRTTQIRA